VSIRLAAKRLAAVAASLAKSDPDEKVRTLAADQLRTAD
jgi:hypothetical protein